MLDHVVANVSPRPPQPRLTVHGHPALFRLAYLEELLRDCLRGVAPILVVEVMVVYAAAD